MGGYEGTYRFQPNHRIGQTMHMGVVVGLRPLGLATDTEPSQLTFFASIHSYSWNVSQTKTQLIPYFLGTLRIIFIYTYTCQIHQQLFISFFIGRRS